MTIQESSTRRGGRDARRSMRTAPKVEMLPTLRRALPVVEPMDADQVERIHLASLAILEDVGVVFRDPVALADWQKAGADVRDERVHLDRGLVTELISTIPPHITYHARNPAKNIDLGGSDSIFVPMTGAPSSHPPFEAWKSMQWSR
jgi:trimethylamine---corrinoid protein Co-methyltransferase